MKLSCIDQSKVDGDCYILQASKKTVLFGSLLRMSSLSKYLPAYFDFHVNPSGSSTNVQDDQNEDDLSPKTLKRAKLEEKHELTKKLLADCADDMAFAPSETKPSSQEQQQQTPAQRESSQYSDEFYFEAEMPAAGDMYTLNNQFYRKVKGEMFLDQATTRFDVRHFQILDVKDIQVVLISTFQELLGAPFLVSHTQFRGNVYLTQPLAQIGHNFLLELVSLNKKRNQQKAQPMNFHQQDQMFQEFSGINLEDWQELYTEEDVSNLFKNHVTVLNYNERHQIDGLFSLTPVSSGFHIGSAAWLLELGQQKFGILTNCSLGLDYRHPMPFQASMLQNVDCLMVSKFAITPPENLENSSEQQQMQQQMEMTQPYDKQISHLFETLQHCLQTNLNAKVLMPVSAPFLLEICDLLAHKIDERIRLVFMGESAQAMIEYANINLDYLTPRLQQKIYQTENPLPFGRLIKQGRLLVCRDIQEYLQLKKIQESNTSSNSQNPNTFGSSEFVRELFLCSHESLRLGDSVYWLHNLGQHYAHSSHLVLTDPYANDDTLKLKPFPSQLKVHFCPVNPQPTIQQLQTMINQKLQPKHLVSPYDHLQMQPSSKTVLQKIVGGQTKEISEEQLGQLKYKGVCPASIASVIRMQAAPSGKYMLSRITDLQLDFKDDQYQVKGIGDPSQLQQEGGSTSGTINPSEGGGGAGTGTGVGPGQNQGVTSHLYYKLLDCRKSNRDMIQLAHGIPDETIIEQIVMKLQLNGYQQVSVEQGGTRQAVIKLEDLQLRVILDFSRRSCSVEAKQSVGQLKTVSELIKQTLLLI